MTIDEVFIDFNLLIINFRGRWFQFGAGGQNLPNVIGECVDLREQTTQILL